MPVIVDLGVEPMHSTVQFSLYCIILLKGRWIEWLKTQSKCLEVKWEVEDHIMMRFNHNLFQFCIDFPYI